MTPSGPGKSVTVTRCHSNHISFLWQWLCAPTWYFASNGPVNIKKVHCLKSTMGWNVYILKLPLIKSHNLISFHPQTAHCQPVWNTISCVRVFFGNAEISPFPFTYSVPYWISFVVIIAWLTYIFVAIYIETFVFKLCCGWQLIMSLNVLVGLGFGVRFWLKSILNLWNAISLKLQSFYKLIKRKYCWRDCICLIENLHLSNCFTTKSIKMTLSAV